MKALKLSISAHGNAAVYSSAVLTYVRNSATRARAALVAKPSSTRSVAAVAVQFCTHLYHAVPSHRLADTPANVRKHVVTPRCPTTVIKMMRLAPNVRSLWRNGACVGRRPSRINSAGCKTSAVVMCVDTSCVAVHTSAANPAIDQENAKMRMAKRARNPAASPRRRAGIRTRTCAMHLSLARKRSHVKARSSLRATARRRSRR